MLPVQLTATQTEYYALRASVAFSFGSLDEWNIVRAINAARRASKDYGLARQLGVSVKTVSRWVGGATQPRMRDLKRIREVFGEVPLH